MGNRLENNKVAARYARALFEGTSASGEAEAVRQDLETVNQVFAQVPSLSGYLENPGIPQADKLRLMDEQFTKSVNPWVARLLRLLVENGRSAVFPQLVVHFVDQLNRRDNITRAEVVTAVELEEELRACIQKTLESTLGYSRVEIQSKVDPGILGGAIIKVQDQVIDGSYVGRLEELRRQIAQA